MDTKYFEDLTASLGQFDLLLAGDGSGTVYDRPCGYCVYLYDRVERQVDRLVGATTAGTNNFAELVPYIHALWFYEASGRARLRKKTFVSIVSDSEMTVRCGNKTYGRNANGALWAAVDWFCQNGYDLRWHHIPRNSNPIHVSCDKIAGLARKGLTLREKELQ